MMRTACPIIYPLLRYDFLTIITVIMHFILQQKKKQNMFFDDEKKIILNLYCVSKVTQFDCRVCESI